MLQIKQICYAVHLEWTAAPHVCTVFPRYRATWVDGNTRIAGRASYTQSLPFGAYLHLQRVRSFTLGVAFTALPKIGIHGRLPPSVASLLSCYWRSNRLLVFAPAKIGLNAQRSKREAVRYRGLGDGATPPNFDRPPWGGLCLRDANTLAYRPKYLLLVNRSRLPPSKKCGLNALSFLTIIVVANIFIKNQKHTHETII